MNAAGSKVRRLFRSSDDDYPAAWSRHGILLTQVSRQSPQATVYTMRDDGRGGRRMARGFAADWSPDGRRILFTRVISLTNSDRGQVFVVDADGSHLRNLSRNRADENAESWRP